MENHRLSYSNHYSDTIVVAGGIEFGDLGEEFTQASFGAHFYA